MLAGTCNRLRSAVMWEYMFLFYDKSNAVWTYFGRDYGRSIEDALNAVGEDGWELLAIEPATRSPDGSVIDSGQFYFKRPKN